MGGYVLWVALIFRGREDVKVVASLVPLAVESYRVDGWNLFVTNLL
jgi:hypothetical protein